MLIKHRDGTTCVFLDVKGQILGNTGCIKISIQGMGKMIIQRTGLFLGKSINFKYCFSLHISENFRRDTHNKKIKELICLFFFFLKYQQTWCEIITILPNVLYYELCYDIEKGSSVVDYFSLAQTLMPLFCMVALA